MEYEKLYDKIDDVCNDINNYLLSQWDKNGKMNTYEEMLQKASEHLKSVAHALEEHLAWDL